MKFPRIFNLGSAKRDDPTWPRRYWGNSSDITRVDESSCMEASAFYRGVIYLSGQLSKIPWAVKDKDNKELDSRVRYLLNVAPNPETNSMKLKLWLLQCALIKGNGYLEIERNALGNPVALWPLNPNKVDLIRTVNGDLVYRVNCGGANGDTVYLAPKDVYHLPNLHMADSNSGHSIIGFAHQTVGISIGADKFANSLYSNGGLPSGILKHKGTLSDSAYSRLKSSWKEQHGGRRTGGTAILEEGVEYSPISHSPDVLQFLESRKFSVTEIARFLSIPPQKLYDTDSSKYSNMEQAQLEVATDTLDTWCRNMESEADVKLLNGQWGGTKTELDLYAIYRGDMGTRGTYFQKMQQTGAMTSNEIRTKEGLPSYPEGDKFYIATNNLTPVDRVNDVIDSQIKGKETPTPASEETNAEERELLRAATDYLKS